MASNEVHRPPVNSPESRRRRQEIQQKIHDEQKNKFSTALTFGWLAQFLSMPFTRNKVLMQCYPEMTIRNKEVPFTGALSAYKHVFVRESTFKHFRGLTAMTLFQVPTILTRQVSSFYFTRENDSIPTALSSYARGFAVNVTCGLASALWNIFHIAQVKMMSDYKPEQLSIYEYKNTLTTIRRTRRLNASGAFLTGVLPLCVYNVVHFTTLFFFSGVFSLSGSDRIAPVTTTIVSALLATLIAHPFDTIRTRMQYRLHSQVTDAVPLYNGMLDCAKTIWRDEGMKGFMRGFSGMSVHFAVSLIVSAFASASINNNRRKRLKQEYLMKAREAKAEQRRMALAADKLSHVRS